MSVTKCMCLGRPLAPGSDRAWSIIYFITTFIPNNHVITTFWDALLLRTNRSSSFFCKTNYRIFFLMYHYINTTLTIILNVYYCIYFTKFVSSLPAHEANRSGSNHL
ncbi:unnamed protein product [Brassica rapa]|uniref:Uncharacterized protein n=1 Tax=Brassica campestris TaxID=3711 RepID=A0A3P5YJY2_BRACM|nr:unnamed protein product [Brassica rapa]VDC63984.1 unnamed protein product [Brassica rapa]